MKTDLERTKEFLDSLGILYKSTDGDIIFGDMGGFYGDDLPECEKVDGYSGFFTRFEFDKNGKFLKVGAWE